MLSEMFSIETKIITGEAKNLPTSVKDTYVTVRLDQEAIFATRTVEKSTK